MIGAGRPLRRFQVGGAVRPGATYVHRDADDVLPAALRSGELCYVLAPRQMGKSSLRMRTAATLTAEGVHCVHVDLTTLGAAGVSAEAWFDGLCEEIAEDAGIEPKPNVGPPALRLVRLLRDQLGGSGRRIVLFIDEIDAVRGLSFGGDDLLGALRSVHESGAPVTPCLLGAAAPIQLASDAARAPFNLGRGVALRDFRRDEAQVLADGLGGPDPDALLDAVYAWTLGHPYMTLRLCEALVASPSTEAPVVRVGALVQRLFLAEGITRDANLAAAARAMVLADSGVAERLATWRSLRAAPRPLRTVRPELSEALVIAGVAAERDGSFVARNPIVAAVLDERWVETEERRRPLGVSIRRWADGGRRPDDLLAGSALAEARAWAEGRQDLSPDESTFLLRSTEAAARRASEAAEARRMREQEEHLRARARVRGRVVVGLGGMVTLLVLVVALLAWQRREAEKAWRRADRVREATEAAAIAREPRRGVEALTRAITTAEAAPDLPETTRALAATLSATSGWRRDTEDRVNAVACADGGFWTGHRSGTVRRWRMADGALLEARTVPAAVTALAPGPWIGDEAGGRTDPEGRRDVGAGAVLAFTDGHDALRTADTTPSSDVAIVVEGRVLRAQGGVVTVDGVPVPLPLDREDPALVTKGIPRLVGLRLAQRFSALGHRPDAPIEHYDLTMRLSPDRLLHAGDTPEARVYDAAGALVGIRTGLGSSGVIGGWSTPTGLVLLGANDVFSRYWGEASTPTDQFSLLREVPTDIAICGEGRQLVAGNRLGEVIAWTLAGGGASLVTPVLDELLAVEVEPDGGLSVALDDRDDGVLRWVGYGPDGAERTPTAHPSDRFQGPEGLIRIRYTPEGVVLRTPEGDRTLPSLDSSSPFMRFSADGTRLAQSDDDEPILRVWDTTTGALLRTWTFGTTLGHPDYPRWSEDGRLAAGLLGTTIVVDPASGAELARLRGHTAQVFDLAFGPGGVISTASFDFTGAVWEADGTRRCALAGADGLLRTTDVTLDGRRVATGGDDGRVRVYDAHDCTLLATWSGESGVVRAVRFSADGRWIASIGDDGVARRFPADPATILAEARLRLGPLPGPR